MSPILLWFSSGNQSCWQFKKTMNISHSEDGTQQQLQEWAGHIYNMLVVVLFGGGVHDTLKKYKKLHSFVLLKKIQKYEEFT